MIRRVLSLAALAALAAMAAPRPALAQGDGAIIVIPGEDGIGDRDAAALERYLADLRARNRPPQAVPVADVLLPVAPLRPLLAATARQGEAPDRLRLQGESDVVDFSVFVAAPDAGMTLQLVTQSSINVLPERSELRAFVNGTFVGRLTLEQFSAPAPVEMALPPGLLVAGQNAVRVEVGQYHRIFCGPEASFALWTDIDLTRSGVFAGPGQDPRRALPADPGGFLAAVAAEAARGLPVEIRGAETAAPHIADWLAAAATRLSATLGGAPLTWAPAEYWTVRNGPPAAARITVLPAPATALRFDRGGDGAVVLVIEAGPGPLPAVETLFPEPSADVRAARAAGFGTLPLLEPGREVALSEIGMETLRIGQHYFRRDFGFRLPEDWLLLTAEKARIRMDYAFVEGLPEGAMLLVQINGETVRLLPMWDGGGRRITRFPVDFEARLLRGGANRISFEMLIPGTPADMPCAGFEGPVLELRDTITLEVPQTPRMWLPDLARPFAFLGPDSLVQEAPGRPAFAAAELMTLRAALAQGAPDVALRAAPRLHLVSLDQLGAIAFGDIVPDRRRIEDALLGLAPGDMPAPAPQPAEVVDLFAPVNDGPGIVGQALDALSGTFGGAFAAARDIVAPDPAAALDAWLAGRGGIAMLVQLDTDRPGDLWLVRGRDADAGEIAAAIARARLSGQGPMGQVALLTHGGTWESWSAPGRQPVLRESVSVTNVRAVLGNYASAAPLWFALAMIALVLVAAFAALSYTISSRGKR